MKDLIRVGMVLDGDDELERRSIGAMVLQCVLNAEVMFTGHSIEELGPRQIDLLILDYGGVAVMGCGDLAIARIRGVIEWAENHPSSALVIWTNHTQMIYEATIKEDFGDLPNVFLRGEDWQWETLRKAAKWLGVLVRKH